jgi:hypothetical protein
MFVIWTFVIPSSFAAYNRRLHSAGIEFMFHAASSFGFRHSPIETELKRTVIILRSPVALPISRAFHPHLPGPEV